MRLGTNLILKISLWLSVFILLCMTTSVFAQGNLHLGKTTLITGLEYSGIFDDNIFRDPDNEESDFIHTLTPSIKLVYPGKSPGNFFTASYDLGIVRYSDFTDSDYEDHKVFAGGGYRMPSGFFLKADDFYHKTADPYGSSNNYAEGRRTERWNNTINLKLGYDFADVYTVEVYGLHYVENYELDVDKFQDRTRLLAGGALLYRLNEKLQLLAELERSAVTYDEQNDGIGGWNKNNSQDNTVTEGLIGARFLPSGKLVGDLKVGYSTVSYENEADKNGNAYNEDGIPIVDAELSYFLTNRTSFTAFAGRNRQSSATANRPNDTSASYINTFWGLGWNQAFLTKFNFDLEFERRLEDYLNVSAGNSDKTLIRHILTADLGWDVKNWLDIGLIYTYQDKSATNSEYANYDYTDTRYGFYIALTY